MANKALVLTLPVRDSFAYVPAIAFWRCFRLRSAAQGAGGPHNAGVSPSLPSSEKFLLYIFCIP
jgi:hypothetical protein